MTTIAMQKRKNKTIYIKKKKKERERKKINLKRSKHIFKKEGGREDTDKLFQKIYYSGSNK